jgi:hypothetical protein
MLLTFNQLLFHLMLKHCALSWKYELHFLTNAERIILNGYLRETVRDYCRQITICFQIFFLFQFLCLLGRNPRNM